MKNKLSEEIFLYFNNIENIIKVENCMTRVRISVKDTSLINMDSLKKINGVMGVVLQDQQFQIIVGPGICNEITTEINNHLQSLNFKPSNNSDNIKNEMKNKYNISFSKYLKVISDIFIPIIPGFIACGLIVGITNILKNPDISGDFSILYPNIIYLLGVFGNSIFSVMMIFIGITASTTFGLSIAVGAALSGILIHPDLTKIILFDEKLSPGRGGIISIILIIF